MTLNPLLHKRADHLSERMESPDCDRQVLFNTYRQFSLLNSSISRWKSLFKRYVIPAARLKNGYRILDIGCGGGDICMKFSAWADLVGIELEITGIDPDPRAHAYRQKQSHPANVHFRCETSSDLVRNRERFDLVISNHLMHHLDKEDLLQLCKDAEVLASERVLFNDIRRSSTGYAAFALTAPLLFRSSFIVPDGLTSIRRSYSDRELRELLPEQWLVSRLFPYRLILMRKMHGMT